MISQYNAIDEWETVYKPIANTHNPDSSWNGTMYETYGIEYEIVRKTLEHAGETYVWTWVDTDEGSYIVAGHAFVNRIGYFITEVPWTDYELSIFVSD